jgi:hypothetical protein
MAAALSFAVSETELASEVHAGSLSNATIITILVNGPTLFE